jgi:hypothetical protein
MKIRTVLLKISIVFNIDNAVDYFIFLNLLYASDNIGKNNYVAKYDTGQQWCDINRAEKIITQK